MKHWSEWTPDRTPDYTIYFDYSMNGWVKEEVHEIPELKQFKHNLFTLKYEYDGVTGKVLKWSFNAGKKDALYHAYRYDARGYLTDVWTSRDSLYWTHDSRLLYYPTGWLRRRELGVDHYLQGMDYAYTAEGWLKAINGEVLREDFDMGRDGLSNGANEHEAKDVFSLVLRYFPNDYRSISGSSVEASVSSGYNWLYKPYYTGWISSWSLNLDTLHTAYSFTYDQLGQLRYARTLTGFTGTSWNASVTNAFSTAYTYDPVGNIKTLKRFDTQGNLLDDLTYHYYDTLQNNRLSHIADAVSTSFPHDLENQSPGNYQYDAVGNMTSDASRNLSIVYNYSNRPKLLNFASSGMQVRMNYNPSGYRFKQLFARGGDTSGSYYIYSFNGQLVSVYERKNDTLRLAYQPIYEGTKRIGIVDGYRPWWLKSHSPGFTPIDGVKDGNVGIVPLPPGVYENLLEHLVSDLNLGINTGGLGGSGVINVSRKVEQFKSDRKYELVDHLGNVRVVIANQRMPVDTNNDGSVDYYKPLVKEISDYYPYGWVKFYGNYEFGANAGSLFEDWDSTRGTYYTLYRLLDARIGRWYQVEVKIDSIPFISGYSFVIGQVTIGSDPLGDTIKVETSKGTYVYKEGNWYNINQKKVDVEKSGDEFLKMIDTAIKELEKSKTGSDLIDYLSKMKNIALIRKVKPGDKCYNCVAAVSEDFSTKQRTYEIAIDRYRRVRVKTTAGTKRVPLSLILGHEMAHVFIEETGQVLYSQEDGVPMHELQAVYVENLIRKELGQPLRIYYDRWGEGPRVVDKEGKLIDKYKVNVFRYPFR